MNTSNRKATGFLIVSLGLSAVLLLACRSRNREPAAMDDDVVLARSELKVPGSIVRQTYLLGTAAKQVAVERLEEVEYRSNGSCDDRDGRRPSEFVVAAVTTTSTLSVRLAKLDDDGTMTYEGDEWTDSATIKKVTIAAIDSTRVVVGTRNNDDTVTLRVFSTAAGALQLLGITRGLVTRRSSGLPIWRLRGSRSVTAHPSRWTPSPEIRMTGIPES